MWQLTGCQGNRQAFEHACLECSTASPTAAAICELGPRPCPHSLQPQFPSTLEKGLNKLMSLKDSFGGMVSQARTPAAPWELAAAGC